MVKRRKGRSYVIPAIVVLAAVGLALFLMNKAEPMTAVDWLYLAGSVAVIVLLTMARHSVLSGLSDSTGRSGRGG